MRRARALLRHPRVEFLVGCGLLLGPLVYALTLPGPGLRVPSVVMPTGEAPTAIERPTGPTEPAEPSEDGHIGMCVDPSAPLIVVEQVEVEVEVPVAVEVDPSTHALEFAPIIDGRVILSTAVEDEEVQAWATGELYAGAGEVDHIAARAVRLDALPLEHYVQRGRTVDVYGPSGKLCTAQIEPLELVAMYQGEELNSFAEEDVYDWETGEFSLSLAERRALVWDNEPAWLSATLSFGEDCGEAALHQALWVRSPALPAPAVASPRATLEAFEIANERARRFLASEDFETLAADYAEYRAEFEAEFADDPEILEWEPTWDEIVEHDGPSTEVWSDAEGQPIFSAFEFGSLGEACGDGFDSYHAAVERIRGDAFVDVGMSPNIAAVFDSDLDGNWELLYDDASDWGPNWTVYEELPGSGPDGETEWTEVSAGSVDTDWFCPC